MLAPGQAVEQGEQGIALRPTVTFSTPQCNPWKWVALGLLAIALLGLLVWALSGSRTNIASATSSLMPAHVAQAGQNPVSATANPVNYTEVNLNGLQLASTGVKPSTKPTKPAVPATPMKCVVFDPNGSMDRFGVTLAVDGTNYVIDQIDGGKLASPNDIQAAQAAKKNWVTVVYDPSGPYAVTSKGTQIPVKMDGQGRVIVPAGQILIWVLAGGIRPPKTLPGTPFGVVPGSFYWS